MVNVMIKNTETGTQTDYDGNFSIEAEEGNILVFSYIGYKTKEVTLKDQKTINVVLGADNAVLEEMVMSVAVQSEIRGYSNILIPITSRIL